MAAAKGNMEEEINDRVEAAVTAALARLQIPQPPAPPAQAAVVNTVAVKLPDFWIRDPDVWFYQAECSFRRARVTSSHTMFEHVVMRLPEAVSISVRSLLLSITQATEDPYEQLKARLTKNFGKTKWQRAFELLDHPEIGDRRPSRLMSDMLALLPAETNPDTLFLALFLRRLPTSIRDHLAAADCNTAEEMATLADMLWDARSSSSVSVIEEDTVAAISGRSASPREGHRRSPERQRPQRGRGGGNATRSRPQTPGRLCKLHKKWGAAAHNCWPPCSWSAEN
jgi:hypothetical protein